MTDLRTVVLPDAARRPAALVVFLAAYAVAYLFGNSFGQTMASPFWFPDSVLLVALLMTRPHHWWIFVVATGPVRLLLAPAGIPFWFLAATFAIDAAKGLGVATALRRHLTDPTRPRSAVEFGWYGVAAVLIGPAGAAVFGAAARSALGYPFWPAWEQWFLGNALANLVITPPLLWACSRPWRRPVGGRLLEGGLVAVAVVVTGVLAFSASPSDIGVAEPRFYLPVPVLFWAAIRFGFTGAAGAVSLISAIAIGAAIEGLGPFAGQSPVATTVTLQHFLLLRAVPVYAIAVLVEHQRQADARAAAELSESQDRYERASAAGGVGVWDWNLATNDVWVDPGLKAILGYADHEIANTLDAWTVHIHPDDMARLDQTIDDHLHGRTRFFELDHRVFHRDGSIRHFFARGSAVEVDGVTRILGATTDVTSRKAAEHALQDARTELERVSRLAALGEFATSVGHEISQPLTAINANVEACLRWIASGSADPAKIHAALVDVAEAGRRAEVVVRRNRDFFRLQPGQKGPLDLARTMEEVAQFAAGRLRAGAVRLTVDPLAHLPPIHADRVEVQQVLLNLLLNGLEAMEGLGSSTYGIRVSARLATDGFVEMSVEDRGVGFAGVDGSRIFDPTYTTKRNGGGVGLSISRTIVEAHGGRIWATSNPDGGATFHVTWPVHTLPRPEQEAVPAPGRATAMRAGPSPRPEVRA